jgi:hypothetical protein
MADDEQKDLPVFAGYIPFNTNNLVKVKLTKVGKKELVKQSILFHYILPPIKKEYELPMEDENGFSEWQLWELMNKLGHMCRNGADPPFETTIYIKV